MRKRILVVVGLVAALLGVTYSASSVPEADAQVLSCTVVFDFIGADVEFTVPLGVTQIGVDIFGAAGGDATGSTGVPNIAEGGFGAGVTGGVLTVAPGDTMTVIVGGEGGPAVADEAFNAGGAGGFGYDGTGGGQSGGDGGDATLNHGGGGGGGASAVLHNGVLVASAGGGGGGSHGGVGGDGGAVGEAGEVGGSAPGSAVGGGATPTAGGAGGTGSGGGLAGATGAAGVGGAGGDAIDTNAQGGGGDAGGGGGGGTFGGGGAGGGAATTEGGGAGGGGGSSEVNLGQIDSGVQDGDGMVLLHLLQAQCPGDLQVDKTVSDPAPEVGEEITYTITATNNGPVDPDTDVVVTDNLPAGVSYVSDDCGGVNGLRWRWEIGDLAVDTPLTCAITVLVEEPGLWTNTVVIRGANPDANPTNNIDRVPIEVPAPEYDLEIVKDAAPTEVRSGEQVTYTLTVNNLGPDNAEAAVVVDALPPQVSYVSDDCGGLLPNIEPPNGGTAWAWVVGVLAVDAAATCDITVEVLEPGEITNTATVLSHGGECCLGLTNNQDDAVVDGLPSVDLAIGKTGVLNADARQVTYTVTAENLGPDDATDVTVTDELPADVAYVSDTCEGANTMPWTWQIGSLAAGATATCTITVGVLRADIELVNIAEVGGFEFDIDLGNNRIEFPLTVPPGVDLTIDKAVTPAQADAGDTVAYTLTVGNLGPSGATGVVVTDALPAGVRYVSDTCQGANTPPWTWQVGNLASGATATCTITATVVGTGQIVNVAEVDGNEFELNIDNNIDQVPITATPAVDLTIDKAAAPTSTSVGANVTYTLTVRNLGPSGATGVVVTDALPAGVRYVSDTCQGANRPPWTWQVGNLAAGATATCTITARVVATGSITNSAAVDANEVEIALANNQDSAAVQAGPATPPTGTIAGTGPSTTRNLVAVGVVSTGLGALLVLTAVRRRNPHTTG